MKSSTHISKTVSNKLDVIVISHFAKIYGTTDALIDFLHNNVRTLTIIKLPLFVDNKIKPSAELYFKGNKKHKIVLKSKKRNDIIEYFFDIFRTFYLFSKISKKSKQNYKLWIGVDNLNTLTGLLLRITGRIEKVVFYCVEYPQNRFNSKLLNILYLSLDRICAKYSDYIWNSCELGYLLREKQCSNKSKNILVPLGVDINKLPYEKHISRYRIVYVGTIMKCKGIELAIDAMPLIIQNIPKATLTIIGDGDSKKSLIKRVKKQKLDKSVFFLESMEHKHLLSKLHEYDLGIAPYIPDLRETNRFADLSLKIIEYLGSGLPVITTNIINGGKILVKYEAGKEINCSSEEMAREVINLFSNEKLYKKYSSNARKLAMNYDWNNIYIKAFNSMN